MTPPDLVEDRLQQLLGGVDDLPPELAKAARDVVRQSVALESRGNPFRAVPNSGDPRADFFAPTVSAGAEEHYGHSCGVTTGGAAYCWGLNTIGQLGNGSATGPQTCDSYACSTTPVAVSGGLTFATVSAGGMHSCGLTTGGAAYCWGANDSGELGNGSHQYSSTPVAVSGGLTFATVSAGGAHSCGVTTSGATYCWGWNDHGQPGDGTTTSSAVPVRVTLP